MALVYTRALVSWVLSLLLVTFDIGLYLKVFSQRFSIVLHDRAFLADLIGILVFLDVKLLALLGSQRHIK